MPPKGGQYGGELWSRPRSGKLAASGAAMPRGAVQGAQRMSYFVTGATGFLGRHLVSNLLKRKGTIHVLVRKDSQKKLEAIGRKMGWDMKRIVPVIGDMTTAKCGVTAAQVRALSGKVKHFFHLAAIYDMSASAESQRAANVDGTQHALDLAAAIDAGAAS